MPKKKFNPRSVALALIGYYPSWYEGKLQNIYDTGKIRGDLAIAFAHKATEYGYRVVVVDGGSSKAFIKMLGQVPKIVIKEIRMKETKRSPKKQRAYTIASKMRGVKAIVSVEMEKISFIDGIEKIVRPLLENSADVVVPKREETLFEKSYPHFQFLSESLANKEYNKALRDYDLLSSDDEALDIFFGPIAFRNTPEVFQLFVQRVKFRKYEDGEFPSEFHDPDQYSNAYFFPTVMALAKKMRVASVTIPFAYPEIQKDNEEALRKEFLEKRKLQKAGILSNLHDFLFYLKNSPRK